MNDDRSGDNEVDSIEDFIEEMASDAQVCAGLARRLLEFPFLSGATRDDCERIIAGAVSVDDREWLEEQIAAREMEEALRL